ncbi:MAG: hypothetical protein RL748_1470 [Pseudomonadota bacterium]
MFEMTLTFDLGVLAVQHDGVLDGTGLTVGQGADGGPIPPKKLSLEPSTTDVEVGQNDGGGSRPPSRFTLEASTTNVEVGQNAGDGPRPPPK